MMSKGLILAHNLGRVIIDCTLCQQIVEVVKPEVSEGRLLLEGDCEHCCAHISIYDAKRLCPECFGMVMHGPSQLVLDIRGLLRTLLDKGLIEEEVDGGIPLGYTLGVMFTKLLIIKPNVPLDKGSYNDEEIEREIWVLILAERAHAMGKFCR